MAEIKLMKRVKYAGDVHTELLKCGVDLETATIFCNNIPDAVDVAPVVHGRWIKRKSWDYFVCSACSYEQNAPSNYCPNCGAMMDLEEGVNGE